MFGSTCGSVTPSGNGSGTSAAVGNIQITKYYIRYTKEKTHVTAKNASVEHVKIKIENLHRLLTFRKVLEECLQCL